MPGPSAAEKPGRFDREDNYHRSTFIGWTTDERDQENLQVRM